jgi:dTDP-4-dehydrorhamnose reductase
LALALIEEAQRAGHSVCPLGHPELDIENPGSVRRAVAEQSPSAIVDAAGNLVLDDAERQPKRAFAVNRDGAANLAETAARAGIPFLHVSGDYVFDGNKTTPYLEDDPTGPLSVYGYSKVRRFRFRTRSSPQSSCWGWPRSTSTRRAAKTSRPALGAAYARHPAVV